MDNIYILVKGGAQKEQSALIVPEKENNYPDPQEFGKIPAYGFFIRHAKNITLTNVELRLENDDPRPPFILEDVRGANLMNVRAVHGDGVPSFVLKNVSDFRTINCGILPDKKIDKAFDMRF
jgi:hypothetical protein